jgi:hypothetical protein
MAPLKMENRFPHNGVRCFTWVIELSKVIRGCCVAVREPPGISLFLRLFLFCKIWYRTGVANELLRRNLDELFQ